MKYLFYLLVIGLFTIGCDSEENRLKQRKKEIETLKEQIGNLKEPYDFLKAIRVYSQIIYLDSTNADYYLERSKCYQALYWNDTTNKNLPVLSYNDVSKAVLIEPTSENYILKGLIAENLIRNNVLALKNYRLARESAINKSDSSVAAENSIRAVRKIGNQNLEVTDNYITALLLDKGLGTYMDFMEMIEDGYTLSDPDAKSYIKKVADANPKFYDVTTLEKMWLDIESGTYKYPDKAGISIRIR
jgi:hypothetical protein